MGQALSGYCANCGRWSAALDRMTYWCRRCAAEWEPAEEEVT